MRKSCTVGALAPILALTLLPAATASYAQAAPGGPVDTARLLQNIEAAEGKITSLQSTVEMNAHNFVTSWKAVNGQSFPPMPAHDISVVAFKGKKRSMGSLTSDEEAATPKNSLNQVTRRLVFDGKQNYMVEQPNPGTENLRPALWTPMPGNGSQFGVIERMYTVENKNIADIIRSHSYNSITNSSSPEFGPLVGIDLTPKQEGSSDPDANAKIHVDLAPAFGYMVVHQRYDSSDGYGEQRVTKVTQIKGIPLPVEADNKEYTSNKVYSPEGRIMPFRFETTHFTHTNLNHVPDSLFVIKMKPGDLLEDDTSRYRIGVNGERILEWHKDSAASGGMPFLWLSAAGAAGLALLGGVFLLRRRRQGRAV